MFEYLCRALTWLIFNGILALSYYLIGLMIYLINIVFSFRKNSNKSINISRIVPLAQRYFYYIDIHIRFLYKSNKGGL